MEITFVSLVFKVAHYCSNVTVITVKLLCHWCKTTSEYALYGCDNRYPIIWEEYTLSTVLY